MFVGKFWSVYTTLLRGPEKSSALATMPSISETLVCIATESGSALRMRPSVLPTLTGASHQPSPHERTPRVAHCSV